MAQHDSSSTTPTLTCVQQSLGPHAVMPTNGAEDIAGENFKTHSLDNMLVVYNAHTNLIRFSTRRHDPPKSQIPQTAKLTNIQAAEILVEGVYAQVDAELPWFVAEIVGKTYTFQLKWVGDGLITPKKKPVTIVFHEKSIYTVEHIQINTQ
ncbi:hypothetical protein Bca52824_057711 [Brassica carinata]|uniref:Uncharacterized protein n=1 Tax=Brassica carinata TaxID=52824 RepID=A0A8X7QS30_BRACI|nr:hypothetical protein Bca52824_057711 [Brassica carinata]